MNGQTFISNGINYYDTVSSSDADNTARRARWLQFLQEAVDELWIKEDWAFSYITSTVSISAASDSGDLPADFMEFGLVGGIWDSNTTTKLPEVVPVHAYGGVVESQAGDSNLVSSLYGNNTTTRRRTLRLMGNAGGSMTIKILYRKLAPTILDATDATSNLWQIPEQYHNTVLMPLVVSKIRKSHGDAREYMDRFEANFGKMVARERSRKTSTQYMPMAAQVRW